MRTYSLTFSGQQRFNTPGRLFRLLSTVNPVTVELYRNGAVVSIAEDVEAGFWAKEDKGFDAVEIITGAAELVKFLIGESDAGLDRTVGTVEVSNLPAEQGAATQDAPEVTNVSGQLLAANAARRLLIVQNNHATGNIFVTMDGSAATLANGIKITPGSLILLDVFTPSGAINAIGDIASNIAVIVVEG